MTTEAIVGQAAHAAPDRPYAPSWVNVATEWIDRAPGPMWVVYVALGAAAVTLTNVVSYQTGVTSTPVDAAQIYYGILLPAMLWLIHHLDRVARSALEQFRPALAASEAEIGSLRYQLSVAPARPAAALIVVAFVATLASYASDPVGTQTDKLGPVLLGVRLLFEGTITSMLFVLVYHTFRQLRLVARLHAQAPRVDLFQPGPLYAFSRLAANTSVGLIALLAPGLFLSPVTTETTVLTTAIYYVPAAVVAVVTFVSPLYGMHRRIAAEKRRLQAEAGHRLEATVGVLHAAVDQRNFSSAGDLQNALSALIAERDVLRRLPTWPWELGTIGAVASAVLLPLGLWLVTRLLERVV